MNKPVRDPMRFSRRQFMRAGILLTPAITGISAPSANAIGSGPASEVIPLNTGWSFRGPVDSGANPVRWSTVDLPHSVATLSWRNWDPDDWEHRWQYTKTFDLPSTGAGQRYFLHFDGALTGLVPTINGVTLDRHWGGYLPFDYEITQQVTPVGNELSIELDGAFDLDVPPDRPGQPSSSVDFWQVAGLYRNVSLRVVPSAFLSDVFAKPVNVLNPVTRAVRVQCTVDTVAPLGQVVVDLRLWDGNRQVAETSVPAVVNRAGTTTVSGTLRGLAGIHLWGPDSPATYQVVATLSARGQAIHDYTTRIGFREARFETSGFFLNGQRLQLRGLNRHQFFPYVGGAMPPRVQRKDVEILRHDLNCNIVRCSHYPHDPSFLDACDELGLLVWEEAPGWGYLGDQNWLNRSYQDVHDMIVRDRNRPSVVVWGVRLNETPNDTAFYSRTQQLASTLDDSRQTTGAMVASLHDTGDFQQDVFGYNDYSSDTAPDGTRQAALEPPRTDRPYLVSEAVGTLSGPSKYYRRTDPVTVQQGQALAHARVHDLAASDPRYCGLLAWCGFDYPSGNGNVDDGIKWPGVVTVFRVPKPGAAIYRSQTDPGGGVVIEPAFYWDFVADWSVSTLDDTALICSNADRLEVFVGGRHFASLLPARETYPSLPYPPFIADFHTVDGSSVPELRIDAYVGARLAGTRTFSSDRRRDRFAVTVDDDSLTADGSDSTRVQLQVVDAYGAPRVSRTGDVTLALSGPATLIGDNPFPLKDTGGVGAVWVRSQPGVTGEVVVRATHDSLGSGEASITVA